MRYHISSGAQPISRFCSWAQQDSNANTCMGPRKPFLSLVILWSMSSLLGQKGLNNFLAIDKHVNYPKIDNRGEFVNHLTLLNFTPTFSLWNISVCSLRWPNLVWHIWNSLYNANTCTGPRKPFLSLIILLSMSSLLGQKGLNNFLAIDRHVHYPKIDDKDEFGNHLTRLNFTPTFSLWNISVCSLRWPNLVWHIWNSLYNANTCMGPRKPFLSLILLLSMSSLLG